MSEGLLSLLGQNLLIRVCMYTMYICTILYICSLEANGVTWAPAEVAERGEGAVALLTENKGQCPMHGVHV